MLIQNNSLSFFLTNFELTFDFSPQNQLIALAFLLITFIVNLYAISQNRKFESLIGSLYCLSSIACVFAGDFISMIISLEFMTIFSCIIIFCQQLKLKPARQYFLTHLFSSGLILIGISLLISITGNATFIPLTEAVYNFELPAIFILAGCLINVGAIFVNGWVVNCYPIASNSGIIYLISFTTKITLIIILKLFRGLEILEIFGISMIIYGLIFAFIEKNLKRILCYLTLSQLGFVLAAISANSPNITFLITNFIFTHIFYNGLFVLYFSILEDQFNIKNYQDLKNTPANIILLSGFIIIILIYISVLPISSSYIKEELANILNKNYIMIFFKVATSTILLGLVFNSIVNSVGFAYKEQGAKPITNRRATSNVVGESKSIDYIYNLSSSSLITAFSKITHSTNNFSIFYWITRSSRGTIEIVYLSFCLITLFICIFYPIQISHLANSKIIIITISISLALLLRKLPRISTANFNLDLYQYIEKSIYFSIDKYKETAENEKEEEKYFNFKIIWNSILNKISAWHNQQTSIFIVMLLLVSLILILQYEINL